jgi:hypothetical protein
MRYIIDRKKLVDRILFTLCACCAAAGFAQTPAQPNLPQYPISDLYLYPNYATRAAYQTATGQQAPPFNVALPIKGWSDPAPNGQPYNVFDATAAATGYVVQLTVPPTVAASVNLPGSYVYPPYVTVPTDAQEVGPYGPVGAVSGDVVCLQAAAEAVAAALQPLYPGKAITVALPSGGVYVYSYGTDPRREWYITVAGGPSYIAQALIMASGKYGVGAPGNWALLPTPGSTVKTPQLQWVQTPQVTVAPAGAVTIPAPIRALLPNEVIQLVPPVNPLFGTPAWMVVRTDLQPPSPPPCTE